MTRLPCAADYMEALQDPSTCFADPELAGGTAALGPLGLPRAVSGNVATVFKVDTAGGRSWAVRCFVRQLDRQRDRYDAIAAHLAGLRSTWRVGFDLQPCGIRVDGEWWPVLKMAWAPGEPLLSYTERHLWDGPALAYLADRFAALAAQLRADGVAHGDLQHGNILVAPGGDLRLVDYDGMYVPALHGWSGTERGHRNYQHPGRENGHFGPGLDHFSSWVIYASLLALSVDPLLWGRLDGGDETLLLRHHDLASPEGSAALAVLDASDGPGVPALAGLLRRFLAGDAEQVPALSTSVAALPSPVNQDRRRSLHHALQGAPAPSPGRAPAVPVRFAGDLSAARLTLGVTAAATLVLALLGALGGGPATAMAASITAVGAGLGRLWHLYRHTPEVTAARQREGRLAGPRRAAAEAAASVDQLTRRRVAVAAAETDAARHAERARADLRSHQQGEARTVEDGLDAELAVLAERERATVASEQRARAEALVSLQATVLQAQLGHHRLVTASAEGVRPDVVHRLGTLGVRTAADFTEIETGRHGVALVRRDGRRLEVSGVDGPQAIALATWRRHVEETVQVKLPTSLPPERAAAIRSHHDAERAALAAEADAARARARRQVDEIRARWQGRHDDVVGRLTQAEAAAATRRVELDRELARAGKALAEAQWHLAAAEQESGHESDLRRAEYLRQVVGAPRPAPRRRPGGAASAPL